MRIGTLNIRNNPDLPRKKVRRAANIAGNHTTVVGLQEIRELEDHTDVMRGLNKDLDEWEIPNLHKHTSTPVAYSTLMWEHEFSGFLILHESEAGLTPRRYASWVLLKSTRQYTKFQDIVVVNTHFINKAWNSKEFSRERLTRQELWGMSWTIVHNFIVSMRGEGYPIFIIGDFNRLSVPLFHHKQVWLYDKGIDKIGYIPRKGVKFKVRETFEVNTPSDHHLKVVGGKLLVP